MATTRKDSYSLTVPIDVGGSKEAAAAVKVALVDGSGRVLQSQIVKTGEKQASATFELEAIPRGARVIVGPENADDDSLTKLQTVTVNVSSRLFGESARASLAAITIAPYYWTWWRNWCRDFTITGTVICPDGKPVPGAIVYLSTDAGSVASAKTDDAGRAGFDKLPAHELSVYVDPRPAGFLPPEKTKAVPEGQDVRVVAVAAAKIAGTVTCEDGSRVQCGIYAYRAGKIAGWGLVEIEGKFTVLLPADDATPVRLQIDLNGDGKAEASADDVAPGTSDVHLVLKK